MRKLPYLAAGLLTFSGWIYSAEKPVVASKAPAIDTTILNRYRWRSIGPDRGGRSIAVSGVRGRPSEGYFGATGGGLWKTTDAGENWAPVTDGQITSASIGAVAVSETAPDVVWIGTGETCIRGNIMPGDGVYKSTDAGKTWSFIGFREADAIAKIRIHPKNPDIVFVASFGKYGGPNAERGVFKTTDGGKTWKKVLYRDDKTGAVDISIDPTNPDVMYAALWEAFRTEYTMSSGGPGSGLFKSTDGGETWTELTRNPGLPSGLVGKIGVSVSPADPNRVYALIENDNGGLFSSDNAGATWTLVNSNRNIRQRAFYYTHVAADPKNRDLVYLLNVSAYRSTDGGKTLQPLGAGQTHGDYHDLWIDPDNSQHMLVGNDGGGAVSTTSAANWTPEDFPTPQMYRIFATTHQPFYVCGSQQDASSFCISTIDLSGGAGGGRGGRGGGGGGGRGGAPVERPIFNVGGSENGYIAQDPLDPDVFFVGTNANGGGFLNRVDRSTGDDREVSPYPRMFSGEESAVVKERWQWTYPIVYSKFDPKALYVGSQRLWVTRNGGQDWTALSGDLTRHDPKTMGPSGGPITRDMNGPEIYGVIFTIAPGKVNGQTIWTGSDDGLIHVTRNGGTTWTNVTPKDMPDFGRVSIIDASAFNAGTAFAAVKRPLLNDRNPYIFRTRDYGATWTKITNGIRQDDYVHTVREDPYQKGVLYAGTQQGVYISYNDGDTWESLSLNLPMIPVSDLVVMPNDIAISTHGRGFYVLDRVNPLRRAARAAAATGNAYLFTPSPAMRATPQGATIQYLLKSPAQGVKVEIMDTTGRVVRTFGAGTMAPPVDPNAQGGRGGGGGRGGFGGGAAGPSLTAGINTVTWDLRYPNAVGFPGLIAWGGGLTGPTAPPGKYRVKLTADNHTQTEELVVVRNSLLAATDADLRAQFNLAMQIRDKVSEANNAVITIRDLKAQIADRLTKSQDAKLKAEGDKLTASLADVEDDIYQVKNQAGQDPLNYPIRINNRLMSLLTGVVNSGEGRPVGKVPEIFTDLKAELLVLTTKMDRVISTGVPSFNSAAKAAGVDAIVVKKAAPIM
jgi:photosystem II stability/assembly factor-like uncharacterized protein